MKTTATILVILGFMCVAGAQEVPQAASEVVDPAARWAEGPLLRLLQKSGSRTRSEAYSAIYLEACESSGALKSRQLEQLAQGLYDPDQAGVSAGLAHTLLLFRPCDFSSSARDTVEKALKQRIAAGDPSDIQAMWYRVVGWLGIESLMPGVNAVAERTMARSGAAHSFEHDEWAALLVCARYGNTNAMAHVLSRLEPLPEEQRVFQFFGDLAYIRTPAAVDVLLKGLYSEYVVKDDHAYTDTIPAPLREHAAYWLETCLVGWPMRRGAPTLYSDEDIALCRRWVEENKGKLQIADSPISSQP